MLLNVFGENFLVPKHLIYSYVVAVIDVENKLLNVLRDQQLQWQTFYKIESSTMYRNFGIFSRPYRGISPRCQRTFKGLEAVFKDPLLVHDVSLHYS